MKPRTKHTSPVPVLLFLFVALGAAILWLGVPNLAESSFGSPDPALSSLQRWTYSLRVLIARDQLVSNSTIDGQEVPFTIQQGESVSSVSQNLQASGLIPDAGAFRNYLIYKGMDSQIRAGNYQLSPSMSAIAIADEIESSYTVSVPFYIYPGWRAEEIAESITTSGIEVTAKDFLEVVRNPAGHALPEFLQECTSAEGFLFPGVYEISRKVTAEELVRAFVERFDLSVSPEVRAGIEEQGYSICEGVILASIIQKETFKDEERARIASVFFNRLASGIKLETDPTVQYAFGYSEKWGGWWKTPLMLGDLDVKSPYNTYQNFGLPPAPIANPELPSLEAVANPEETAYFFFRANCDNSGYHVFSVTFEEHLSKGCK